MSTLRPLRPHQVRSMEMLRESIAGGKRCPLLWVPTGGGKTVVAAHIVTGARAKHKRVAFGVPSISLIDQTFSRFVENGIDPVDMGVLQGDHEWTRPHAPIQICSAQTLARRGLPDVDVAVIDEAHLRFEVYDRWMTESGYGPKPMSVEDRDALGRQHRPVFIGLSATPWSKALGLWYDDLLRPTTMVDLIKQGYLSRFRVFAPTHPDLVGVKTVAGDYHEGQLGEAMGKAELVADIVNTWLTKARGLPTLCFCVNRAHAQKVAEQFSAAGVRTAYVDANTPREERDAIGKRLAAGEVEVVCNIGCLTTGVDWDVRCISLCRPTKSEMLFVQIIGRGLRPADGKADCLVLDHSDTTLRLGMVTDIDHDELDDGKPKPKSKAGDKEEKEKLPKECQAPECGGLIPYGAKECPCCGDVVRRPSHVEQREGELVELTPGSMKPRGKRIPVLEQLREMGERSIYGQLRSLQTERDKSDGWVAANFKAVFDKWPPRRWDQPIEPEEPSYALRSWIKARSIAYAKAMEAKNSARNGVML